MGHPLVMSQFRQTCKPFRNRNYPINLSSWDPIFRTLETRYLIIVIVKYNEKIYNAKPSTWQNHNLSLLYKCLLLELWVEKVLEENTQMWGYRSQVHVGKVSGYGRKDRRQAIQFYLGYFSQLFPPTLSSQTTLRFLTTTFPNSIFDGSQEG